MSGPAYTTHNVSLFGELSGVGTLIPAGIGASLILAGMLFRLVVEQTKAASGQRADFAAIVTDSVLSLGLLALYPTIAANIWAGAQQIATDIYPDGKLSASLKLMMALAQKFQDYSLTFGGIGAAIKDSAVVVIAFCAWILTLLAHWQLEVLQVCVYNIVFTFAPVLIGLQSWGFNGRKIWFSAVLEVSSWSITMAIIYRSIDSALFSYLKEANSLAFTDMKFLDVISVLVFLSSLPFIVPIVTGRLLGSAALGELANATVGAGLADKLTAGIRSRLSEAGPVVTPGTKGLAQHGQHSAPNGGASRRPGDS